MTGLSPANIIINILDYVCPTALPAVFVVKITAPVEARSNKVKSVVNTNTMYIVAISVANVTKRLELVTQFVICVNILYLHR